MLSKDDQVSNARLVLESDVQNNNKSHLFQFYSLEIYLKKNHYYYIEVLLTQQPNGAFFLKWRIPTGQRFEAITTDYIFTFMPNNLVFKEFMKLVPLHNQWQSFIYRHPRHSILQNTEQLLSVDKYLEWDNVKEALPLCKYQPGFVGKTVLHRYHAVEDFVNPSYVYPQVAHSNISDGKWIPWFPLNEKEALDIVDLFLNHLETAYPRQYKLKKILNIEKKPDWHESNPVFYQGTLKNGDRFFLELLLWDEKSGDERVLSEYIYQPTKNSSLCYPEGMQWNKKAPVYLLISARKQASWLWYFIHNVGRIYKETKDENLHVVVYDYDSTDINIEKEFMRSSFENFVILKNPDSMYSRTFSLNRAAEAVKDPHAIIFTIDLHLEIPPTFANNVRKHCIYDKMVYTPILTRLVCGASPSYPSGSWDPWGYGMFGACKANWDKFKGFDEVQFRTKWGGEDWDLVDRAYRSGLEFERIKMADFYHYDHSKVGLWT
ncbi:beta-1,4-N-acetylgalactosaminyltransferase 3-like isoform X2 [Xenia sp. Carnegie-2017]|nr:beta-1,4-N-acetylgalactosaminyltransferase 3-like isoform X2 [Xenia sp. Carnegie-2017]